MGTFFNKLFGVASDRPAPPASDTETVRKIIGQIESLNEEEARFIAAFAFVLARVANADQDMSAAETERMESIVRTIGGLDEAQAVLVVQIAKSQQHLMGGTENYLVTREFEKIADRDQKVRLLHCLFEVSAADDEISLVEEDEISRIAGELRFDHREFSDIRSRYNDKRSILKR